MEEELKEKYKEKINDFLDRRNLESEDKEQVVYEMFDEYRNFNKNIDAYTDDDDEIEDDFEDDEYGWPDDDKEEKEKEPKDDFEQKKQKINEEHESHINKANELLKRPKLKKK